MKSLKNCDNFVDIGSQIILLSDIHKIDLSKLISETIDVTLVSGEVVEVTGFPALQLLYLVSPSTLEGKPNIRFKKHYWAIHNIVAHPLMQILAWCKCYKQAMWIHNVTVPTPIGFKK